MTPFNAAMPSAGMAVASRTAWFRMRASVRAVAVRMGSSRSGAIPATLLTTRFAPCRPLGGLVGCTEDAIRRRGCWKRQVASSSEFEGEEGVAVVRGVSFRTADLDLPGFVSTGDNALGEKALQSANRAIEAIRTSQEPVKLAIFSFGFSSAQGLVVLRLDKEDDRYGSPTLDDIGLFSKMYGEILREEIGEDLADDLEVEISSPVRTSLHVRKGDPTPLAAPSDPSFRSFLYACAKGAERQLRIPEDLSRYAHLPVRLRIPKHLMPDFLVDSKNPQKFPNGEASVIVQLNAAPESQACEFAFVKSKANENVFGRKKMRKVLKDAIMLVVNCEDIIQANLYIDF